jgi:translocation and assembly module TamB
LRRFLNKRNLLIAAGLLVVVSASTLAGILLYLNSSAFNDRVRQSIILEIEGQTGATVSLATVRWDLRQGRLVLEDLTVRGTEPQTEPPLAHVDSISAGVNLRNLLQRRLDLSELNILRPRIRLLVNADGQTNLPGPPRKRESLDSTFAISINNLKVTEGSALVNDRYMSIDFNLANLASESSYRGDTQVLSVKLAYSGTLARERQTPIPYVLSTDFDFTRGTIVAQRIDVTSGKSSAKLQGRIDHALTPELLAKLEYSGELDTVFLNHFFPREKFVGRAKATGSLVFKRDTFSTEGSAAIDRLEFQGWSATAVKAKFAYSYPEKQLLLQQSTAKILGGTADGRITVASLPGEPRVSLDMRYADIDAAQLEQVYPWERKYMVYSRASGTLAGWFEPAGERYEVEGESHLTPYTPPAVPGIIAFPATGDVAFAARPGDIEIKSSNLRFFDTTIQASGRLYPSESALNVQLRSSNLANLHFLHKDANGAGSFDGTLNGPIQRPRVNGKVVLDDFKYKEWTVQHAEGVADLDVSTERVTLANVKATLGQSSISLDGSLKLDGSSPSLRVRSERIRAEDFAAILKEKIAGTLSGDVVVTSLDPLKLRGHVKGSGLAARGRTFEAIDGDLVLNDPSIEIENLTASERGARLTDGKIRYNRVTEEIDFQGSVAALNLNRIRDLGIPETIEGVVQRARLTVGGTIRQPRIGGDATIENLVFREEVFPRVRLQMSTAWPVLTAVLTEAGNLDLSARINLSDSSYPVQASAKFQNYSLEKLAQFSHGVLIASGDAELSGSLRGSSAFSAKGVIRAIRARIEDYPFEGSKPFGFSLDANQLKLTEEATFSGPRGTSMNLSGAVGLTEVPRLDLTARGNLDLRVFAELYPSWSITGIVAFDGHIGGTSARPNVDGRASFSNASLGYEGVYTSLTMLTGDVRFSENRVTFDNLVGRVGGGTIHVRGTGLIQNNQVEGLNVQIETEQVRFRYPAGLRSSVTGTLLVKGTSNNPMLDGDLTIESMTYRSDFEPFLAIFRPGGLDSGGTALDRLRLSVHIAGNRNITIQNELTDIRGARIDLDIKGTLGSPSLTGHVEISDGTLLFQGKRYDITRGNIDFVDPLRIDPVVNVQAESDLRDYRVILGVTGQGDKLGVDLRSDPPLPELELVSLIAGGKTRQELQETGATSIPTSEELFQGGAASVLVDLLRSRLGNRFGLLGLDRVRIDPYLVGAGNKSAQITLSVTRDLSVTYSQDLSSNQQRVIQVEYFLSKNLSLVASREENNETTALGLDIRLRKRF